MGGHIEHGGYGLWFLRVFAGWEDCEAIAGVRSGWDGGVDGLCLRWNRVRCECALSRWRFRFDVFVFREHGHFDRCFGGLEDVRDGRGRAM
jgi:hypothetical protein